MTTQIETTEVKAVSKAAQAQNIFTEEKAKGEEGLRARVLTRFETELGLKKQGGGSTYFQNCKTKDKGEKVKHYRPSSKKSEANTDTPDDSKEDAELFDVTLTDGSIKSFLSQEEADAFKATLAE